jgi:nitrite reductase/ring-hydroxylating ferredoxin subunit
VSDDDRPWTALAEIDPATAVFPISVQFEARPIWVFRAENGDFFGVQDTCPHTEQTLGNAKIVGGGAMIRCAFHHYTFKLATGAGVNCPGFRIDVYDVKAADRGLLVRRRMR